MNDQRGSSSVAPESRSAWAAVLDLVPRILLLAALAYLGFYVYGVVLGVFSPGEMIAFTVVAVGCLVAGVVHGIRIRRAMMGPDRARISHQLQKYRETRGW